MLKIKAKSWSGEQNWFIGGPLMCVVAAKRVKLAVDEHRWLVCKQEWCVGVCTESKWRVVSWEEQKYVWRVRVNGFGKYGQLVSRIVNVGVDGLVGLSVCGRIVRKQMKVVVREESKWRVVRFAAPAIPP